MKPLKPLTKANLKAVAKMFLFGTKVSASNLIYLHAKGLAEYGENDNPRLTKLGRQVAVEFLEAAIKADEERNGIL